MGPERLSVPEFLDAVGRGSLERRCHQLSAFRAVISAPPEYHETIRSTIEAFDPPRRRPLFGMRVFISDSAPLFDTAEAEYRRHADGGAIHRTGTRIVKLRRGLLARQEIPSSVRSGDDLEYCYVLGSLRPATACLVFHPRSAGVKHTFVRACIVTLLCQSRAYHCVHGGAIALDGKGILLLGPRRSGKTTLLLHLRLAGGVVLSDNLSFVSHGRLIPFFLMKDQMFNVGPEAYASVSSLLSDGEAADGIAWNADGRRLFGARAAAAPAPGTHVPLECVIVPSLSSSFRIEPLDAGEVMTRYEEEIVRPELELFAAKFRRAWLYRWKTRRYWKRQLNAVPVFSVSLDKRDMGASIDGLQRFVRQELRAAGGRG